MKGPRTLAAFLLLALAAPGRAALPPLHVRGHDLVDDRGRVVVLRGVNFGNWLVLETYFYGVKFKDERALWATVKSRFGEAGLEKVRAAHRDNWITAADFSRVKAMGLNSVRVPFWSDVLESDDAPGKYSAEGWKRLDFAVSQCEAAGLYCILDLHGAPGGQSTADHTGAAERNQYWGSKADHDRAAAIWTAVAARYRGRSAVAAFDLLNEPMGAPRGQAIVDSADELYRAVRAADPDRLVVMEDAYRGLDIFPAPASKGWTGVIFSQHHYATFGVPDPKPEMVEKYFKEIFPESQSQQKRLGAPVFVGEWNVMDKAAGGTAMTQRYVTEMEGRGWSWAVWTFKQCKPEGVSPDEFWSFYRNDKPQDLPDFEKDPLDVLLKKIASLRTEEMSLFKPMRDGVGDPGAAVMARAQPRVRAVETRMASLARHPVF